MRVALLLNLLLLSSVVILAGVNLSREDEQDKTKDDLQKCLSKTMACSDNLKICLESIEIQVKPQPTIGKTK